MAEKCSNVRSYNDGTSVFWIRTGSWWESSRSKGKILCFNPNHLWTDFLELNKCPFYFLAILNIHAKADQETLTSCICSSELTGHRESEWLRTKCSQYHVLIRGKSLSGQWWGFKGGVSSVLVSQWAEGKEPHTPLRTPQPSESCKRQRNTRVYILGKEDEWDGLKSKIALKDWQSLSK